MIQIYDDIDVELEYNELYTKAEELHGENPEPMVLEPDYSYEVKSMIIAYKQWWHIPEELRFVPDKDKDKSVIEDNIKKAIEVLEKYVPHYLNRDYVNPFVQRELYNATSESKVWKKYKEDFIRMLVHLGLSQRKSIKIEKFLREL